jgi:hypothetical protein
MREPVGGLRMKPLLRKWLLLEAIRQDAELKHEDLAVAHYLCSQTDLDDGVIRGCGHHKIAAATRICLRSAIRSTGRILKGGYFEIDRKGGGLVATTYRPVYRSVPEMIVDTRDSTGMGAVTPQARGRDSTGPGAVPPQAHVYPYTVSSPDKSPSPPPSVVASKPKLVYDAEFTELRELWPADRRNGLTGALADYEKVRKTGVEHVKLIDAAKRHLKGRDPQYVCSLKKWLKEGHYRIAAPVPSAAAAGAAGEETYAQRQLRKIAAEKAAAAAGGAA